MRKLLSFIFTVIYATMSSGAPSLLHYCAHEEAVHLSVGEHDHQEAPCCSDVFSMEGCHSQETALHPVQENDDCCANTYVDLDFAEQESKLINFALPHHLILASSAKYCVPTLAPFRPATRLVQINGPPLFIMFHRLTLYG